MPWFIVRVELHEATSDDYDELHEAMERVGFSRTVQGDNGRRYRLPSNEYQANAGADIELVYATAKAVADATRKSNHVLASEYARVKGYLPVVA